MTSSCWRRLAMEVNSSFAARAFSARRPGRLRPRRPAVLSPNGTFWPNRVAGHRPAVCDRCSAATSDGKPQSKAANSGQVLTAVACSARPCCRANQASPKRSPLGGPDRPRPRRGPVRAVHANAWGAAPVMRSHFEPQRRMSCRDDVVIHIAVVITDVAGRATLVPPEAESPRHSPA